MQAVNIGPEFGKENLKLVDIPKPAPGEGKVLVKITHAGVNPIDYGVIHGRIVYNLTPIPHIPGSEAIGEVETDGKLFRKGDRVMIYNRVFDGTCKMCRSHMEHLCSNGGILGVVTQGVYTEYISISEKNLFHIPESMSDEVAVSLPIGALTSYRALMRAGAKPGQSILIYGASGNTGIFASQLASLMGLEVYGVYRKGWIKDYGCIEGFKTGEVPEDFKADIVMNSIGASYWQEAVSHLATAGKLVSFGVQTGKDTALDIAKLYTSEMSIIGSTGGSLKDMTNLLRITENHELKAPVASRMQMKDVRKAMEEFEKIRNGRLLLVTS